MGFAVKAGTAYTLPLWTTKNAASAEHPLEREDP